MYNLRTLKFILDTRRHKTNFKKVIYHIFPTNFAQQCREYTN